MSYVSQQISRLARQLFPNGRAFWIPIPGFFDKLNVSTGGDGENRVGTLEKTYNDTAGILNNILPDNAQFTDGTIDAADNDCNDWERRMGLVQYGVTSATTPTTEVRKQAIATKMNYPGTNRPRQSAEYLETQLRSAGFDVHVYENLDAQTPGEILGIPYGEAEHGLIEHGETEHGGYTGGVTKIAQYLEEYKDEAIAVAGDVYHSTFIIAGSAIDVFADVQLIRKTEFRQQILRLKPAHMIGFLFINYV
jgi:uncharacterized protein YmfQ (DUF2313 family)